MSKAIQEVLAELQSDQCVSTINIGRNDLAEDNVKKERLRAVALK